MQITDTTEPIANKQLPVAIICDIDGTLAIRGDRGIYDYARCWEDTPNRPIVDLLLILRAQIRDLKVLFVTGREDSCLTETMTWLTVATGVLLPTIYMRKAGDYRQDAIVKREIYEREIKGRYEVLWVLDDRDQVVKMWREQGLTCLQVAEGNF